MSARSWIVAARRDDRGDLEQVGFELDPHVIGLLADRLGHEPAGVEHAVVVQRQHRLHQRVGDRTSVTPGKLVDQPTGRVPAADGHRGAGAAEPDARPER